jgi:hypothetical protein
VTELPDDIREALSETLGGAWAGTGEPGCRGRLAQSGRAASAHGTVFVKWPAAAGPVRRLARLTNAYEREVRFYRELSGDCPIRLPAVHAARYDPFLLVLEDLTPARPGDTLRGSVADVRNILRAVACLHAAWAGSARLAAAEWLLAADSTPVRRQMRFDLGRITRAPSRAGPAGAVLPVLAWLSDALIESADGAGFATLLHGDLHADQVLFPQEGDCVIIDWQYAQRGPVGVDLARLLTLSLAPNVRRRHEPELLETYRTALAGYGAPALDRETLLADYRRGIAWTAYLNTALHLSRPDRGRSADILFGRIAAAVRDHGLLPAPAQAISRTPASGR